MAFDVFISYSDHDKPIADAACAALESANIRCWIAPRDISPGRDYGEAIIDAIENAKVLVLILSGRANTSPQIKREVERAVSKGLVIVPVRIEDVAPSRNLEYFISSPHWLDAFPPPREKYFAKLIESVQALLATGKAGAGEKPDTSRAPTKTISRRRVLPWAAATAATLIAITAGALFLYQFLQPAVLVGHGADADSVSFTPNGKMIAAGGWDASIQLWTVADGKLQLPGISGFQGHSAPFSPDGKTIAGGSQSGNNVLIWNVSTRQVVQTFSGHTDKVQSVAFSHDGNSLVSGGNDNMVYVWDLTAAQTGRPLAGHTAEVYSVAFSSGDRWIASASFDESVIVWDMASGLKVATLAGTNKMNAAVFSPDDRFLATAGGDGDVRLWDTSNWLIALPLPKRAGGSGGGAGTGGSAGGAGRGGDGSTSGGGSPGRGSSAGGAGGVPPATVKMVLPGDGQIVTTVAFSPNKQLLVSGGYDNAVRVWNTLTGTPVHTFTGHTAAIWAVGFSPDGEWIASASSDKTVRLWKTPKE